jgi:hypothetical protein
MRSKAGLIVLVAALAAIAVGTTASPASAHACSSGFYATHPDVVDALLTRTAYGTNTTLQQLFRLPPPFANFRRHSVTQALRLKPTTSAANTKRIFLRAAAAAYLNALAWPAWPGPSTTNLRSNVHLLLASRNLNRMRAYQAELARENNARPCLFLTAKTS